MEIDGALRTLPPSAGCLGHPLAQLPCQRYGEGPGLPRAPHQLPAEELCVLW